MDAILYYEPEGSSPSCGSNGGGQVGGCFIGIVTDVNKDALVPPYHAGPFRNSELWSAGCSVRYQASGVAARANVGSHELGHFLGLGQHHAPTA